MEENPDITSERHLYLLSRLDERTKSIQTEIINVKTDIKEKTDKLEEMIKANKDDLVDWVDTLDKNYVRKETFTPVQKIVYGLVGLVLSGVALAVISLVVVK